MKMSQFHLHAIKTKFLLFVVIIPVMIMGSLLPKWQKASVEFTSHESKHSNGNPIFNRIAFFSNETQNIWMMQQQQGAYNNQYETWDRLAIVHDRSKNAVHFLQLQPGKLEWSEITQLQSLPHKVACLNCHLNGPRMIRPDPKQTLSLFAQLKVAVWNYNIKRLPRLSTEQTLPTTSEPTKILQVKTCLQCHNDSDNGRNFLEPRHALTLAFMMQNHLMPPSGEKLSKTDLQKIFKFITGH